MESILKRKEGVTLSILIITIVVLVILAGVTINISRDSLTATKKYNFISELELVQEKMLVVNKEISLGSSVYNNIGIKYDDLDSSIQQKVLEILTQNGITDYSKYTYMSKEDLAKIGLKNIEQDVIISYGNSIVYSYEGIKINGNTYYSINELKD